MEGAEKLIEKVEIWWMLLRKLSSVLNFWASSFKWVNKMCADAQVILKLCEGGTEKCFIYSKISETFRRTQPFFLCCWKVIPKANISLQILFFHSYNYHGYSMCIPYALPKFIYILVSVRAYANEILTFIPFITRLKDFSRWKTFSEIHQMLI